MPDSIISYDKDLPEIPGRLSWEKPDCYLVKDITSATGWSINESGRRPSQLLLVTKLREVVDDWRESDYPGVSEMTHQLLSYWFKNDHHVSGFPVPFRYYFCQREAIETLIYTIEILKNRDIKDLISLFATITQKDLLSKSVEYQTAMTGQRQIRRFIAERNAVGIQDLPPYNLRRYAFKMATGSGKTWVMAMAIVWSYFYCKFNKAADLSPNFLIVAPNVIVYQRLARDFAGNRIFHQLPMVPPEWRPWNLKVILRGDTIDPDPYGNIFLTNIHQIRESKDKELTPLNAIEAILGKKPAKDLTSDQRSMLERIKSLSSLIVINDEAHHVHEEDLAWSRSLLDIHDSMPKGLSMWLDFSATPKDQHGMYFPWTLVDYPLAQAVEDRIVKAPIIVTKQNDRKNPAKDPEGITKDNIAEKYGYWIHASVDRWKEHNRVFKHFGIKPVLFIMADKNLYADAIGKYLLENTEFGFKENEVQVIHTDKYGDVKDLDAARVDVRSIDEPTSKIKVIVSVMMLREGWDVRSVSIVLGLRPFTAAAEILPEQVIGRGLRLMIGIGPDNTQTLEVLGTKNLLDVLREQLETEGVGVGVTKNDPPRPVTIEPVIDRRAYDIGIPITKPRIGHNYRVLSSLDVSTLDAIYNCEDLDEPFRISLKMEFATTETEVHQADLGTGIIPMPQELIGAITSKVIQRAKLANVFADIYPIVRQYIETRCFDRLIDLEDETIRSHIHRIDMQEGIAKYLSRKIGELTLERREIEFEKSDFTLSDTMPFSWRRNLPPLIVKKTIFNFVATYNDFERSFAEFLDKAKDVLRFASLGTTAQGASGTQFYINYLKPSGAIGFYHPDFVVVQIIDNKIINWIIETKGRVWEGTEAKDEAMQDWCDRVTSQTGQQWKYARINQADFYSVRPKTLQNAVTIGSKGDAALFK